MLCFRSIPFFLLILPLCLFISSTFFSFSHGSSQLNQIKPSPIFSGGAEKEYGVVVPSNTRRSVAENVNKSSLILAAERTYRRDPFERFKSYSGGWNISNVHYWASVGFTAGPLFVIAGIWFVVFGISLCLICLCYCCCRREPYGYSRVAYALSLIFLIVFTIAAIIGCIVLYMGQGQFHSSTTNILGYVVDQADTTAEKLRSVSYYLSAAKKIGVGSLSLPEEIQSKIDNVQSQINGYANILSDKTAKNKDVIKETLNSVRLALIILAAVMLLLAFLGFLFSILGLQCLVYSLVIVGWILVTLTFILCGIFLLLHKVTSLLVNQGKSMMAAKFDIEKFDGKNDFNLQRVCIKALFMSQGLSKALQGMIVLPKDMKAREGQSRSHGEGIMAHSAYDVWRRAARGFFRGYDHDLWKEYWRMGT